ncbi:preprotein translocase subunit TatC [Halonotius terrestris]|uniref:Sec-independent protein translocase protein TatC n=1 Tax=Halonotius terrestris TaxID=2487750 RepID=A0A8J8PAZ8_9EURY|nr:twin-arginine translocase subunit TatC [Halonotius terrestris]TQQ79920.1 preprotein translocase subunit TatC [Halonotius terrestris]
MASALDDDTQRALGETTATARAMLRSAQKDLQKVFIVFLLGFLGTFYALRLYIWDFLRNVTESRMRAEVGESFEIIAQTPFDVILLQAKIGLVAGLILALPVFLYFSRDALKRRGYWPQLPAARWKLTVIGLFSAALFVGGAAYGYAVFFPVMFGFLAEFGFDAGFAPRYSIVLWTEFIVLLTLSFGLAAQMPLAITGLSYAEIVPYETFRDKWRHAVVGIFVFGAVFSPPDPFTQIMWAIPLVVLYGLSLYLAKVVVTTKRGSEQIEIRPTIRRHWNVLLGIAGVGAILPYAFYEYGGRTAVNSVLAYPLIDSRYRILPPGEGLGTDPMTAMAIYGGIVAAILALVGLAYLIYAGLDVDPHGEFGDPTAIDLSTLDAAGIKAAPPEAFIELTEDEAMQYASAAIDEGDQAKAQAILDRFDETEEARQAAQEADGEGDGEAAEEPGLGDRASRAGDSFLDELTDGEQDTDDIGGYYKDIAFVAGSLRSKSFRLVATFMVVLAGTFTWFYVGGLGAARENFLSRLPPELVGENTLEIITLHPVEALLFMVKFSVIAGALAVLPMVAYYAWPALRELGVVRGKQHMIFVWTASLVGGLFGGFLLGYLYVAPEIISYLVADAQAANMRITYRINDFFWLIIFTTAGIGLLADIPILMLLLNRAGLPYQAMRNRWREVTIALLSVGALLTPADIITMFLVTVPLMAAYGIGLAILFLITAGGRRNLAPPAEFVT